MYMLPALGLRTAGRLNPKTERVARRYLPVYVLPALLVHRSSLLRPATAAAIWLKVARGAARSSLFLALYCTLAWRGASLGL